MKTYTEEPLLSSEELAEKLKISRGTIRRWKNAGLPHLELSETIVRFRLSEVIKWRTELMAAKRAKQGADK